MNRRILKKLSKRAVPILRTEFGSYIAPLTFYLSDGDETLDAPTNFPRRQQSNGFSTPLKGTPMFEHRSSYEYEEYESRTAHDELEICQMNESDYWECIKALEPKP